MSNKIPSMLEQAVADTYALYIATLSCHWNMVDSRFLFLHEMLEDQYKTLAEHGDLLAEQLRQLGHKPKVSMKAFAEKEKIGEAPDDATKMLQFLEKKHLSMVKDFSLLSKEAEKVENYGLLDLLGSLIREHTKIAWMLRSHFSA